MARKTYAQARAKNAKVRTKVDAAKALGHQMHDLVRDDTGWWTVCACGWESRHFPSSRLLAGNIAWHLSGALAGGVAAGDPIPNAYEDGGVSLRGSVRPDL